MSIRSCSIVLLVLVGLQVLAAGQNQPSQEPTADSPTTRSAPAPALTGIATMDAEAAGQADEDVPQIPALLGGQGTSLALITEMERSNYLRFGVNVGGGYDDNARLTPIGEIGNETLTV